MPGGGVGGTGFHVGVSEKLFKLPLVGEQGHEQAAVRTMGQQLGLVDLDAVNPGSEKTQGSLQSRGTIGAAAECIGESRNAVDPIPPTIGISYFLPSSR